MGKVAIHDADDINMSTFKNTYNTHDHADTDPAPLQGLVFVRADKDSDGDYDPLTSTSWDGDSFSTGTGTINWNTEFGVPSTAKSVNILLVIRDSGAAGQRIEFKAKSTTTNWAKTGYVIVGGDVVHAYDLTLPLADDGSTYYNIVASDANTLDVWIRVVGWYI